MKNQQIENDNFLENISSEGLDAQFDQKIDLLQNNDEFEDFDSKRFQPEFNCEFEGKEQQENFEPQLDPVAVMFDQMPISPETIISDTTNQLFNPKEDLSNDRTPVQGQDRSNQDIVLAQSIETISQLLLNTVRQQDNSSESFEDSQNQETKATNNQVEEAKYQLVYDIIRSFLNETNQSSNTKSNRGRPKKSVDTNKSAILALFNKYFMKLVKKMETDHRIDSRTSIVARAMKGFTDEILKYACSIPQYKNKDIKIVLSAYLQAYKIFIDTFGAFNEDLVTGFLHFIALKFPETRVTEILDDLEANDSISSELSKSIRDQLKIRTKASKEEFSRLTVMNSCYEFISILFIRKAAESETNRNAGDSEVQKQIFDILTSIQEYCVYSSQ